MCWFRECVRNEVPFTSPQVKAAGRSSSSKYSWGSGERYESRTWCPSIIWGRAGSKREKRKVRETDSVEGEIDPRRRIGKTVGVQIMMVRDDSGPPCIRFGVPPHGHRPTKAATPPPATSRGRGRVRSSPSPFSGFFPLLPARRTITWLLFRVYTLTVTGMLHR